MPTTMTKKQMNKKPTTLLYLDTEPEATSLSWEFIPVKRKQFICLAHRQNCPVWRDRDKFTKWIYKDSPSPLVRLYFIFFVFFSCCCQEKVLPSSFGTGSGCQFIQCFAPALEVDKMEFYLPDTCCFSS